MVPTVVEHLGAQTVAYAAVEGVDENFCATLPGSAAIRLEAPLKTGLHIADCHLFDENGQAFERRVELTDIDMELLSSTAS